MGKDNIFCMNCGQKLPVEAKFCFSCGQRVETGSDQDSAGDVSENVPCRQEDMASPAEKDVKLTLAEFREQAPSQTGFREQLLAYRKSLPDNWDYNAFVGILLGVGGPKHGDAACMNFAIGQGDNGNNTKRVLAAKGLMSVFEKYKGKKIDETILLSDVEDEIVSAAPDYAEIRRKFHEIVFTDGGGQGGAAAVETKPATAVEMKPAVVETKPATAETEPAAAEAEDVSGIIDFFVEVLALRVLEYVTGDKTIDRADVRKKFLECRDNLRKDQQEFEAYFGTSAEAKWLYSARSVVERSISRVEGFFDHSRYKIDEAVSLLQKLPEGKYGIAYYALAKCYGVGIDALIDSLREEERRVFVLRPNVNEMGSYLAKAAEAQKPVKEALIDLGCIRLSRGEYQKAEFAFEMAKKCGDQKASIYLRYIECCKRAVPAINGQRATDWRNGKEQEQHIYGNIVEYKDRVYWMCEDRQSKEYWKPVILCSVGADRKRTVLARMEHRDLGGIVGSHGYMEGAASIGVTFSICNDLIYYENGSGGICTMRLDGSDKRELELSNNKNAWFFSPMAFPEFLLYVGNDGQIWKLDQNGAKTKIRKVSSRFMIAGVSEREINIENKEIIDLRTLERRTVAQKYPAVKKKTVFYIDMAREIAYYEDNTDTGNYRDRRLIGVNTHGEIVDYWEMPLMPYDYEHLEGYYSFCFDGLRLSFKLDAVDAAMEEKYKSFYKPLETYMELWEKQGLSEREWPHVALFDRKGNRQLLHQRKQGDWRYMFGAMHMMTKNGVVILEQYNSSGYWNTYYPIRPKGTVPPAQLDFFT